MKYVNLDKEYLMNWAFLYWGTKMLETELFTTIIDLFLSECMDKKSTSLALLAVKLRYTGAEGITCSWIESQLWS